MSDGPATAGSATEPIPGIEERTLRVLVVDDDALLRRLFTMTLKSAGFAVETAPDGAAALHLLQTEEFDVVLSDISMPGMNGLELLKQVRKRDLDLPVILVTGQPDVSTAIQALEYGALKYLIKPVDVGVLREAVTAACRLHRVAELKRVALSHLGSGSLVGDRAGLEASFDRALESVHMVFQPIVRVGERTVFGYEALVRTSEPTLPKPETLLDAAERLGRVHTLGQVLRARAADAISRAPDVGALFVNLHPKELTDPTLTSPAAPLSRVASRVVLEITERESLHGIGDVRERIATLRRLGFRLALDDLGAGYAGLSSFALIEPEVVKLDMGLVRNVHGEPIKQRLIRSMVHLCQEAGMLVVAEGVESGEERNALVELGCDLLQGYLFGRPSDDFAPVIW